MADDSPSEAASRLVGTSDAQSPLAPSRQYGAPRRFGIGTIFVVTTAFALLFGFLTAVHVHPAVTLVLTGYLVFVGLAQMVLFGGKNPRLASIIAGAILLPAVSMVLIVVEIIEYRKYGNFPGLATLICPFVFAVPFGALTGYCAGGLVGGVFLIMDAIEQKIFRSRADGAAPIASVENEPVCAEPNRPRA